MRTYYHDNLDTDQRDAHDSGVAVSEHELQQLGVLAFHFDSVDQVDELAKKRHYVNRDDIKISPSTLPGYAEKLKNFYAEHLHEDEEIRYILAGEGYFDVRDKADRWVRCLLGKGDLLILPAGIYHRFTPAKSDYIHAMRLFKEEPKWVPYNRPCDENAHRVAYVKSIS